MSKKILSLISIFFLMLFALTACKKAKGIISIQVEGQMVVGETYQVKYELEKIDETLSLTWKVSDKGIAEFDSETLTIKALKAGSFTLTVTAESGETASIKVTVVEGSGPTTKYTISYELDGGTASNAPTEYDGTKDVVLPTPTKEGYNFLGWYEKADFSGNAIEKIAAGSTGDKTFYAKWEEVQTEETYTITYEVNGGTLSGETTSYTTKDEVTLATPKFVGYTFAGWYEKADFSGNKVEKLVAGSTGNKTFYAKWEEVEYAITYEANGGTLSGEVTSYTVESQDITLVEPTREGYIFKGWYANANFGGSAVTKIAAGSTGDKTFYAKWETEKTEDEDKVYSISYVTNGGTLANAPTEYDGSTTVYLVNPLRRGYTFQGWYETDTFAGKAITSIPKGTTGNVKLYAKWIAINYSINYNFNGGAWGEEKGTTSFTVAKEIELVTPVRKGYTFKGWYKDASFDGAAVEIISKGTVGSVNLYAKWEANEYTITYNLNEGSWAEGAVVITTFTPDDEITLSEPVREKYNFLGWYDNEKLDGTAVKKIDKGIVESVNLYAKWELAEFSITYELNGGHSGMALNFSYIAGTEVTLPTEMITKTGYNFSGWYENAEFTGNAVTKITADSTGNKTFYAKWEANEYTITYNLNEGSWGEVVPTLKYTIEDAVVLACPTREGYNFLGWYDNEKLDGNAVTEIALGSISEKKYWASWEIITYSISYDLNGGSWDTVSGATEFEYGTRVVLQTPVKSGYIFLGWVEDNNYVEKIDNKDYQLVAKWKSETQTGYEVIFDLNGGKFANLVSQFADEIVADFNNTGQSDAMQTTKENFKATTNPNIKYVFNQEANLTKYKWLFEFALSELALAVEQNGVKTTDYVYTEYYLNTKEMLEGLLVGNTSTIGGSYANGRTIFRWIIEGIINKRLSSNTGGYDKLMIDYSKAENIARFETAYGETLIEQTVESTDTLPVAVKEGYNFLGWYLDEQKVESVSGDVVLFAKYEVKEYTITLDYNGGALLGKYATREAMVADFLADFNAFAKTSITSPAEYWAQAQKTSFWKNAEMYAKWSWIFEALIPFAKAQGQSTDYLNNMLLDTPSISGYATQNVAIYLLGINNDTWNSTYKDANGGLSSKFTTVDCTSEEVKNSWQDYVGIQSTYTIEQEVVLPTLVKEGHIFKGWQLNGTKVEKIEKGTYGNLSLVAIWEELPTESDIQYELNGGTLPENAPIKYTEGVGLVSLPTPTWEGHSFKGWYLGEQLVTAISAEQTGKVVLTASWEEIVTELTDVEKLALDKEALTLVAETKVDVTLTLAGTNGSVISWTLTEGNAASIEEGVLKVTRGATDATIKLKATLTLGEATDTKEFTLVVKALEALKVYVGAGLDYETLDEAIIGVEEGTTIVLAAGEYTLSEVITKSVAIEGPNVNLPYAQFSTQEAIINVAKDVAGNLKAKKIVFNGVHLKGTGGTSGVTGVYFQDGGNVEILTFKSSVISNMNTFLKFVSGQSAMELTIEGCHIHTIGQFILWAASSNITKTTLMNNYVDGSTCGGVTNAAAALFRVRSGSLEAYHNYFNGDSQNDPGYFEALNDSVVKYNTFKNVTKYVHPTAANKIVFDQNLYLNANGEALTAAPSMKGTVTVDTTVATSAEQLEQLWEQFSATLSPNYEYNINYELNGGSWKVVDYTVTISGNPTNTIDCGTYDNSGMKSGIYFCDSNITPNNSLRWQYKIILSYDSTKNAYLVVAVDAATVSTNTAAGGAENWTHAIASASTNVSTYATVGQYIVIDTELSVGMDAFTAKVYDASAITSTENVTTIEHAEKYSQAQLPLELAKPVKDGKEFYGWYFEADFSGDRFFTLPEDVDGEVTIYARFVEPGWEEPTFGTLEFVLNGGTTTQALPTEYQFGVELTLPTLTRQDYNFLGWTLEENGTNYLTKLPNTLKDEALVLYAQWELDAIYVGKDKEYKTIAAALEAAEEGTMIIVDADTFDEAVKIEKRGIILVGTTNGDAMTTLNSVTIDADNVVLEGLKLTATNGVTIKSGNNVVIYECKLGGTATDNNQTILHITGEVTGLQVLDCEFNADNPNNKSHYRAIYAEAYVTNTTIRGNVFKTNTATTVYIDSIKLAKVAGITTIEENTFDWPGHNFTVFVGSSAIMSNATININRNNFVSDTAMSGFTTRNADDTTTINYIGNVFHNVKGTVMEVRGTSDNDRATKSKVTIANNAIQDTSSKISIAMSNELVVIDGNYIFQDVVYSNNTATPTNPAADKDAALAGMATQRVTFVTNGGVIPGSALATFIKGVNTDVTAINPRLYGMRLVGWYDNANLEGTAVTTLGAQTADVTLYAKYENTPVYKVTYELNGGTAKGLVKEAFEGAKIVLPTPELLGSTFLGWSLTENSTDYITSFELIEDITVYANWTTAKSYNVTFILNGGSINYASREALVNDFVADYNEVANHSYATVADIPSDSFGNIDFHTMFTGTLSNGTTVREKWLWLAEYLYELSVRDLASNNCNVLGLKALINNSTYSGDAIYGVSYAFRAFLKGTTIRPGTSYKTVDFSVAENANGFWSKLSAVEEGTRTWYEGIDLPKVYSGSYDFVGWYTNAQFEGDPITQVTESTTVYAKFIEGNKVESITITNKATKIKRYETLQLTWAINPTDATIQTVKFESSNPSVATIDDKGLITALTNGTVTIKIISQAEGNKTDEFELEVYSPEYITGSYKTNSYVYVGQEIELLASVANGTGTIVWSSSDDKLATVTDGSVLGVAEGTVTITASLASDPDTKLEFAITVLNAEQSDIVKFLLAQHNSNIFTSYNLAIGAGAGYDADIYGSVSKILLNKELEINSDFLVAGNETKDYYENSNIETQYGGLQFITFHYTAGFDASADSDNHAAYFTSGTSGTSIHYVTGNAGNANGYAEVYKTLDHAHGAWHAGDSLARTYSNSTLYDESGNKRFEWIPTGVAYDDCDLLDIQWSASDDFYFEINGKKTTIKLPDTYNYVKNNVERHTDHIYNADGTISSKANCLYSSFSNRTPESFFNDQGFAVKVINGEYYMGPTWWSYGQVLEGRICAVGGNLNSIGIESCVNKGSDLWYTWQISAKLIAKLLTENNLTIDRVKGHHFFDGKNCPQPLLENDLEIWYEFIDLIKAELAIINEYKDYEIKLTSNNTEIIDEHGRVTAPEYTTSASYTLTISKDGQVVDTITLASMIPSIYEK